MAEKVCINFIYSQKVPIFAFFVDSHDSHGFAFFVDSLDSHGFAFFASRERLRVLSLALAVAQQAVVGSAAVRTSQAPAFRRSVTHAETLGTPAALFNLDLHKFPPCLPVQCSESCASAEWVVRLAKQA